MAAPPASPSASTTHSPAALVYDHVCHVLSISARPDCRALLRPPPAHFSSFCTQHLAFPDEHAVALCCALLATQGAAPGVVHRFLVESTCVLARPRLPAIDASFHPYPPHPPHPPTKRTRAAPCFAIDFSANSDLSPRGAAAVLVAALLMPAPQFVELDLNACTAVASLTLRPWLSFLEAERISRPAFATVSGLNLDGCPVRSLDLDTLHVLSDLKWISLRYTAFTNLWRCADIVRSLPRLVAALFKGSTRADVDSQELYHLRGFCRHALLSDDLPSPVVSPSSSSSTAPHDPFRTPRSSSEESINHVEDPLQLHNLSTPSSQERAPYVGNTLNSDAPTNLKPSPVSSAPSFFEFILACAPYTLQLLDGVRLSSQHRESAMLVFDNTFEPLRQPDHLSQQFSMLSLLRNREEGFSRPLPLPYKGEEPSLEHPNKRRRRSRENIGFRSDLMAAVAAGFSVLEHPSAFNLATSVSAALAAASSAVETAFENAETRFDTAAEPDSGSQDMQQETPNAPWPVSAHLKADHELRNCYTSRRQGLTEFCPGTFEDSASSTLIRRPGAPRIRYLKHETDRARQFEYNPARPSELVYGTENGYMVVLDEESGEVKGSCMSGGGRGNRPTGQIIPRTSDLNSLCSLPPGRDQRNECTAVYGLSWLHKQSDRFLAGTNNGAIHVYNVNWMGRGDKGGCMYACETFQQLTSLHVSCDDVTFAVSGSRPHVGLFDLETGKRKELLRRCHTQAINVIKFAHRSPHVLVTSSFDQFVKKWDLRESRPGGSRRPIFEAQSRTDNVMACFSPDDSRLLVSAVDNEVRQYSAVDGRMELEFKIPKTGSLNNFTRSYYMNDRDYMITGSCNENVVRVYNARTGAFFTEVDMDNRESTGSGSLYVQSLRGSLGKRFSFSALLAIGTSHGLIANVDLHSR